MIGRQPLIFVKLNYKTLFNLFKGKPTHDDFYTANKIAPEKEHLLNIGALLLEYNQGRDSLTLKSRWPSKYLGPLLNEAWGVNDKESAIELLDELLELPSPGRTTILPI